FVPAVSRPRGAAPTHVPPLSLHDALPISGAPSASGSGTASGSNGASLGSQRRSFSSVSSVRGLVGSRTTLSSPSRKSALSVPRKDRKSTRLNSSHEWVSYAVLCVNKKNEE